MVALWEVLSDKGWALYPKEVSELMNSACTGSVLVNVENSLSEPNSFEIDLQTGTQTSSSYLTTTMQCFSKIHWQEGLEICGKDASYKIIGLFLSLPTSMCRLIPKHLLD